MRYALRPLTFNQFNQHPSTRFVHQVPINPGPWKRPFEVVRNSGLQHIDSSYRCCGAAFVVRLSESRLVAFLSLAEDSSPVFT